MSTALANSSNPGSREKILDVAEVLFARQGFAGISMNDVASPVGLSKSSLFHHFSGKMELYAEVCERVLGRIAARVLPALEGTGPCGEKLDAAVGSLCDVLSEHPHTARLLLRALVEDELFEADRADRLEAAEGALLELVSALTTLMGEGVEDGTFCKVSLSDATQTVIGAVVFHYASGETGERILGEPIFSNESIARRKREVTTFIHRALAADSTTDPS